MHGRSSRIARTAVAALVCSVFASSPSTVVAGVCGDDVGGNRVACRCGDTVVSDVRLQSDDPVVGGRCPLDGLIIRASALADSVTLDLAGHAIVGSGFGAGVRVEDGGNDGATIVGGAAGERGEIVGFGTGLAAMRMGELARVERIDVKGSRHDGMFLRGAGLFVVAVGSHDNGANGIRYEGTGGRLMRVSATGNAKSGLVIHASRTEVEAAADDNGHHGIIVDGRDVDLSRATARNNQGHGALVRSARSKTEGFTASANRLSDLRHAGG